MSFCKLEILQFKLLPDQSLSKVCPPAVFLEGVLKTRKTVRSSLEELVPQSSSPSLAPSHLKRFCAWFLALLLLQRFLPPCPVPLRSNSPGFTQAQHWHLRKCKAGTSEGTDPVVSSKSKLTAAGL